MWVRGGIRGLAIPVFSIEVWIYWVVVIMISHSLSGKWSGDQQLGLALIFFSFPVAVPATVIALILDHYLPALGMGNGILLGLAASLTAYFLLGALIAIIVDFNRRK